MKTLVISDIHHKFVRAQSLIETIDADRVVLLGDYFDAYGDNPSEARATAIWLKEKVLYSKRVIALIGNHDTSYIWPNNPHYRCSGYTDEKSKVINEVLTPEDKAKFNVYHIEQGFLFSHAGLSNQIFKLIIQKYVDEHPKPATLEFLDPILKDYSGDAIQTSEAGFRHFLFSAGWDRHGLQQHGGINWVDWDTFSPISGINQIFGHSSRRIPEILVQKVGGAISKKNIIEYFADQEFLKRNHPIVCGKEYAEKPILSVSYNLDSGLNHYMVISDGHVDIFDYFNQINLRDISNFAIPSSPLNNLS